MASSYVCSEPNCAEISDTPGPCDAHRRAQLRAKERLRASPAQRGYDAAWRRTRARYLRGHPRCERCGQPASHVHHRERGPLDPGGNDAANLEALCERCHAIDSGRRRWAEARPRRAIGSSGRGLKLATMPWGAPPPPRRPIPDDVRQARDEFERANAGNRSILEPLIQAHLSAYDAAIAELDQAHRLVADETALELGGTTRQAAMWLITGRCIGLARAAHALVSAGYTVAAIPVLRSLHEAWRLLALVTLSGQDAVVDRWLRGKNVARGDIMAALDRQEEAMRVEMIKDGLVPPGTTGKGFERHYGLSSEIAHHRRRHLLDQVSIPARTMAAGPHPDWCERATTVDHFGWHLTGLVSTGGSAFGHLLGATWFHDRFQPTLRALVELMNRIPLEDIASGQQRPPRRAP